MSSPQPAAAIPGPLGSVVSGYALAWTARRPLLAVLLPVVAAILLVSPLLDLLPGGGRLVIVDRVAGSGDAGVVGWAELAAILLFWLLGLVAGGWAVARHAGPVAAFRQGLKYLPAFAVGLVVVAGCVSLGLRVVAGVAGGWFGVVLTVAALVAGALVAARVLLGGVAWAVGGAGRRSSWAQAAAFLLGGVVVPLLIAYARERSGAGPVPYAGVLVDAVMVTAVLAAQVGLAVPQVPDGAQVGVVAVPQVPDDAQAGLAAVPQVPEAGARRPARLWPGAALVAAAVLVSAGMVAANPYAAPLVRTHDGGPAMPVAVAWPAGQHPVIVTTGGVWYCDDDLCETFTDVHGGPPAIDGYARAGIGADGTVVKTAVTGGPDKGGPFVRHARCARDGCREAWLPVRASAAEKLDLQREAEVEAAGAVAPDGALWLFVAAPVAGGEWGRYRFSLIRCADVACAAPQRHQVGTSDRTPKDGYPNGRRARLSIGADGRPVASFWLGWSILQYRCEPVTCAEPRETGKEGAPPDAIWDAAGDRAVSYRAGQLYDGATSARVTADLVAEPGALALAGDAVYVAAALPSDPDSGFRVTVGAPGTYWRQTVWRCAGFDCVSKPMDVYPGEARRALLAVAEDGRVLVVRDDRIVLLETPFA